MQGETVEEHATRLLLALREIKGAGLKGVSEDKAKIMAHNEVRGMTDAQYDAAARFGQMKGWLRVRDAVGKPAFSLVMMETGQLYLDQMRR